MIQQSTPLTAGDPLKVSLLTASVFGSQASRQESLHQRITAAAFFILEDQFLLSKKKASDKLAPP